jgi:hypothetical protein
MKAWLNFYKEHSQAIFRLKVVVLIIANITQKCAEYDDFNSSTISQLRTITSRMRLLREWIFELRGVRMPEE